MCGFAAQAFLKAGESIQKAIFIVVLGWKPRQERIDKKDFIQGG